jgi:hypothetical protein
MKQGKKLTHILTYPLYIRYGDIVKNKLQKSAANASVNHQIEIGYQMRSIYKDILFVQIEDDGNAL